MASEWISVKDHLPMRDKYVLWALAKKPEFADQTQEGFYEPWPNGMQFWRATRTPSTPRSLKEVTHWMPLPAPPEPIAKNGGE